jgi:hypothetical protein
VVFGALALCAASFGATAGCSEPESPPTAPPTAPRSATPPPIREDTPQPAAATTPDLVDEAAARGVDYVNVSGSAAKRLILEANGAGVALIDLGNDGDLDIVFAQGAPTLDPSAPGGVREGAGRTTPWDMPRPEAFVNDGTGRFQRGSPWANFVGMWTTGLATGDIDGDGDDDLVVAGIG